MKKSSTKNQQLAISTERLGKLAKSELLAFVDRLSVQQVKQQLGFFQESRHDLVKRLQESVQISQPVFDRIFDSLKPLHDAIQQMNLDFGMEAAKMAHSQIENIATPVLNLPSLTESSPPLIPPALLVTQTNRVDEQVEQAVSRAFEKQFAAKHNKKPPSELMCIIKQRLMNPSHKVEAIAFADKLAVFSDDTIRYDGKIITMRRQLRIICTLLLTPPGQIVTACEISDATASARNKSGIPHETVAKYISELRSLLDNYFHRNVISAVRAGEWHLKL